MVLPFQSFISPKTERQRKRQREEETEGREKFLEVTGHELEDEMKPGRGLCILEGSGKRMCVCVTEKDGPSRSHRASTGKRWRKRQV